MKLEERVIDQIESKRLLSVGHFMRIDDQQWPKRVYQEEKTVVSYKKFVSGYSQRDALWSTPRGRLEARNGIIIKQPADLYQSLDNSRLRVISAFRMVISIYGS